MPDIQWNIGSAYCWSCRTLFAYWDEPEEVTEHECKGDRT